MPTQAIDLPGIGNARELGGYAAGKRHVKKGVLLRTADITQATPEALERLHDEYRVQTVVDFRMTVEHQNAPDPQILGAENRHLTVIEMEDFPVPEDLDPGYLALLDDPNANRMKLFEISYELGLIGPGVYEQFFLGERGKGAFASFFRELLALGEDRAILWHCTDGKDRTGCAAMLLLSALGANRQTIMEDYLLTNDFNAAKLEAVRNGIAAYPMPQDKLDALMFMSGGVAESYLAHAFDVLDEHYGGVEGYLRDELGVGAEELELLRNGFLA